MERVAVLIALLLLCASFSDADPLPPPLSRASQALDSLMTYFQQTERGGKPEKRSTGCPCYTCSGKNCTQPYCDWCSTLSEDACPSKESNGCYTTNKADCACDEPSGPLPYGANTAASFYFSCAQIGGLGPWGTSVGTDKCECESDWLYACTNCYRWWSAVALEASVNYCMATKNASSVCTEVATAAESMWIHSPYNGYWDAIRTPVFIDDFAWYAQAYLRVFEWTGNDVWRKRSLGIHDWAWKYGWDNRTTEDGTQECGGFYWNLEYDKLYKDSISIVEMLYVAVKHATLKATPDADRPRLVKSAQAIWDWLFEFDNGDGLIAPNGLMSTAAVPEYCCRATKAAAVNNFTRPGPVCSNSRVPGMSYNHGILLSSAPLMYQMTGDEKYLSLGTSLLDAAIQNLTDPDGSISDTQRGSRYSSSYACSSYVDIGSDFFSFKGIYVAHLSYYAEILSNLGKLDNGTHTKILTLLQKSSDSVWTKAMILPPFKNLTNLCEAQYTSVKTSNSTAPKFYWWWSEPNATLETPPDNRVWFDVGGTSGLRCTYHNANQTNQTHPYEVVLWNGTVANEDACKQRCGHNENCTKYTFYSDAGSALQDDECKCYTCAGKACYYPTCDVCTTKDATCPTKTSQGCYTTSSAECECSGSRPGPSYNCWNYGLFSHENRTHGPGCTAITYYYKTGAKRPPPPTPLKPGTTCRNRCNESSPADRSALTNQTLTCFCDTACARHVDCCLDYVEQCVPEEGQRPTCKGKCNNIFASGEEEVEASLGKKPVRPPPAVPIRGGGYCYCHSSCFNYFTDNNSLGSCCADQANLCEQAPRDPVCLDARTSTQALHLFVAHHVLENQLDY